MVSVVELKGSFHRLQGEGGFLGATISQLHDLRAATRDDVQSMRGKKYGDPNVSYDFAALADDACRKFASVFCETFDKKGLGDAESRLEKLALALNPQYKDKVPIDWLRKSLGKQHMPFGGATANFPTIIRWRLLFPGPFLLK